jgi:hypothetical protein|tara:strand:+ start:3887 stop:4099 length:213 start_codon:yes stop_codon:yes gene_type:complete
MSYHFKTEQEIIEAFWVGLEKFKPDFMKRKKEAEYGDVILNEWFDFLDMISNDNHASFIVIDKANKLFLN